MNHFAPSLSLSLSALFGENVVLYFDKSAHSTLTDQTSAVLVLDPAPEPFEQPKCQHGRLGSCKLYIVGKWLGVEGEVHYIHSSAMRKHTWPRRLTSACAHARGVGCLTSPTIQNARNVATFLLENTQMSNTSQALKLRKVIDGRRGLNLNPVMSTSPLDRESLNEEATGYFVAAVSVVAV